MTETFTNDDLLRFLYNELPNQDRKEVESAQLTQEEVIDETIEMGSVKSLLDGLLLEAPNEAVQNILDYSKSLGK